MLTKYKKYLQSYYNARDLAPADKYLPTLHTPYINLAMISRGRHDHGERDEFTLKTLHGGVDQILESKSPINIEDLLTPEITPVYLQGGLTAAHLGVLTPAHLGGLTPYRLGSLTPSHVGGLTPSHLGSLTPSHLGGLTPTYLGGLTPAYLGILTPSHLGSLTPSHLGGLTPSHLGELTPEYQGDKGPYNREGLTHEHSHMPFSSRAYDTSFHEGYSLEHSLSPSVATAEGQRSGKPVRFLLVEGPPGIGKSTFAWELCRRWDEIESLRDYHTVVLLKLREKWVLNATSLSDLFRYPSNPDFSKNIAEELVATQGKHLLLVLDGFDEVSHSFHEDSVIKSILCKQLLPECTIILTTRPSAKATLESVCQPPVDKHVEIIGFTEEERVRYITEVFSKEPELQANFLKYMFLVPHIKSMMYIPLNCAIIAQVYSESQSSHRLAIPRTRTQLYKALAHSLLVRHMKMKEGNREHTSMLPEGLKKEDMERFRVLAKFAFDSYHKGESKKVTFFKEDIPEGLVHFGFMNESTEMYAGKAVEQTFSFLHLSLQEYLAAWHIAHSYSIEFQVAYHGMALRASQPYRGSNREEEDLLSSLEPLGESLVEPALFLAGITGWRCQSEDGRNHWEMYLSHDTAGVRDPSVLLRSLYEAQNPTILSHYFNADSDRREIDIGTDVSQGSLTPYVSWASLTPYDCYALSYCLAHSSDQFSLSIDVSSDDDVSLVETFVKGLEDHCKPTSPPTVRYLRVELAIDSVEGSNKCMFWLAKAKLFAKLEEIDFKTTVLNSALAHTFLQSLVNLQSLVVHVDHPTSWVWLAALRSLRELKVLHICSSRYCSVSNEGLREVVLDIELPSNSVYDVRSSTDALIDSLLKSVLRSNQITRLVLELPNISRETVAGVHSILLHCPSLTSLELKRTRLGYDGILHICSALRNNTTLKRLVIEDDDLQVPPSRERNWGDIQFMSFLSMERVALPSKTTCTDFLLELDNILKTNTTLEEMKIQSGLFLPLSAGEGWKWTGLGPLQQFNVRAVGSGRSPNLRRSFSSSDLTQPQTLLFWDRQFIYVGSMVFGYGLYNEEVDFKKLFSLKKEKGQKLFSLPSFTAPDTEVLQSFSGLDPRLKECLEISYLNQYVRWLRNTCWGMMVELSRYTREHRRGDAGAGAVAGGAAGRRDRGGRRDLGRHRAGGRRRPDGASQHRRRGGAGTDRGADAARNRSAAELLVHHVHHNTN